MVTRIWDHWTLSMIILLIYHLGTWYWHCGFSYPFPCYSCSVFEPHWQRMGRPSAWSQLGEEWQRAGTRRSHQAQVWARQVRQHHHRGSQFDRLRQVRPAGEEQVRHRGWRVHRQRLHTRGRHPEERVGKYGSCRRQKGRDMTSAHPTAFYFKTCATSERHIEPIRLLVN